MKCVFFLVFAFFPSFVFGQVVVNEIAWMGTEVELVDPKQYWRYEWIELYNITDAPVIVEGWTIELHRAALEFQISLRSTIAPKGYLLAGASDRISNVDINYSNLSGRLANSGQRIVLKNAAGGIIEEIDARENWFDAGDNETKQTMERRDPFKPGNNAENWGTSLNPGGTPKAQNSIFGKRKEAPEKMMPGNPQGLASFEAQTKKDFQTSSFDLINRATLIAAITALLSSLFILGLRLWLRRSSQGL